MKRSPARIASPFAALPEMLPRHAEEGTERQRLTIDALTSALVDTGKMTAEAAEVAVTVMGRLFDAYALLDRRQLESGVWAFVSFPAYLAARSISELLADPGARVLPDNYWEQGAYRPPAPAEQQREILRFQEQGRLENSVGAVRPIRYVYVAWGLIRLGNEFLLCHREDRVRRDVSNFVFPGGRLNHADLPERQRGEDAISALQSPQSALALQALPATLKRELSEELNLASPGDYAASEWQILKPYRQVEGARNNHAYTEYLIRLFHIKLTAKGEARLLDLVTDNPDQFTWFSPSELARESPPGTRAAFVDAMLTNWGKRTEDELMHVPDSTGVSYRFDLDQQAVSVPFRAGQPFRIGKTGKERSRPTNLDHAAVGIVLANSWHAKGLPFDDVSQGVVLLPGGWVKIDDPALAEHVLAVTGTLRKSKHPFIECHNDRYFRMSIAPEILFFNEELFRYDLGVPKAEDGEWTFRLTTDGVATPLGVLKQLDAQWPITENIHRAIELIASGKDPVGDPSVKGEDLLRDLRDRLNTRTRPLGLRRVVGVDEKNFHLVLRRISDRS